MMDFVFKIMIDESCIQNDEGHDGHIEVRFISKTNSEMKILLMENGDSSAENEDSSAENCRFLMARGLMDGWRRLGEVSVESKTRKCVLNARDCVLKTRGFVFKMVNSAGQNAPWNGRGLRRCVCPLISTVFQLFFDCFSTVFRLFFD